MSDQQPDSEALLQADRLAQVEQRQQRQDEVVAQIHEILLLIAQRQQESESRSQRIEQQQEVNAQQIAANAHAIAELRSLLQDRYGGNGHGSDRP